GTRLQAVIPITDDSAVEDDVVDAVEDAALAGGGGRGGDRVVQRTHAGAGGSRVVSQDVRSRTVVGEHRGARGGQRTDVPREQVGRANVAERRRIIDRVTGGQRQPGQAGDVVAADGTRDHHIAIRSEVICSAIAGDERDAAD